MCCTFASARNFTDCYAIWRSAARSALCTSGIHVLQAFLSETLDGDRFEIKETLMPDSMHPSAVGMRIIATRLEPLVSQLVASAKDMPQRSR